MSTAPALVDLRCTKCSVTFTQKSSLVRHSKRCLADVRSVPRQKSCEECIRAKSRCTLMRPKCERCLDKRLACRYPSRQHGNHRTDQLNARQRPAPNASDSPSAAGSSIGQFPTHGDPTLVSSKFQLPIDLGPMGRFPGLIQRAGNTEQHALQHTIRVLRTYPRMLSARTQLPPFVHHSQTEQDVLPPALKTCHHILTKYGRHNLSLQEQVMKEIASLNKTATLKTVDDLLASAQAFVIYAILRLFPDGNPVWPETSEEQLILDISEISLQLASSGLALHEETAGDGQAPLWRDWAIMSAKRRTILTIYMLTWAWSVRRHYPTFYCHELQLMFAPSPKALWQAQTEVEWLPLYRKWLHKWRGDGYRVGELLSLSPKLTVDKRTEDWLEEVDEFGMLLMSQVNAI